MPVKIVFVQGSPRKNGNTRAITQIVMASAKEKGAEVAQLDATQLAFKEPGCVGCQKCQQSKDFICAFDDEVAHNVARLPEYDLIVLATPLYWWSYSAQLKIFVDRMYSLSKILDPGNFQSRLAGKTLALIATAGGPIENNLDLLVSQWKNAADILGSPFLSCLFPITPPEPGVLLKDPVALKKAEAFGRSLASIRSQPLP